MRTAMFLTFLCLLAVQRAHAQSLSATATEPMWVMRNDSIIGELVLDTAQRRLLVDVERRYQHAYDEVMDNDTLGEQAVRLRLEALSDKRRMEVKKVMTPAQYEQWLQMARQDHRGLNP